MQYKKKNPVRQWTVRKYSVAKVMKAQTRLLNFFMAAVFLHLSYGREDIGFRVSTMSAEEGEDAKLKIRLGPNSLESDISGEVVPLSLSQYDNYTFTSFSSRTISAEVENEINMVMDMAEYDDDMKDFNNAKIRFTILGGTNSFSIDLSKIIKADSVNEAEEQLILVLEINDSTEVNLDRHGGVLVLKILDKNPIFLLFKNVSNNLFESNGTAQYVITVAKSGKRSNITTPPATEVDIPFTVEISSKTASYGTDFNTRHVQNGTFRISELEVELDPITIFDDEFAESNESFLLILSIGEGTETLNIFPKTPTSVTMTIVDNDVAEIGFMDSYYSVNESDSSVTVCIHSINGLSFNHGDGSATINIMTISSSAIGDIDYGSTPNPSELTLQRGQEEMCSNITINDDALIEGDEIFTLSLSTLSTNFSAGVVLSPENVTIEILDNDVAEIGFVETEYCVTEPDSSFVEVTVCINITNGLSFDHDDDTATIINITTISLSATGDIDYVSTPDPSELTIQRGQKEMCSIITIKDDALIEGNETFALSLSTLSTNFSTGVLLSPENAIIKIVDNDGVDAGFATNSYSGDEGDSVEVCVTLFSDNLAILNMSDFEGHFIITGNDNDTAKPQEEQNLLLTASTLEACFNVTLIEDDLIEETETVTLTLALEPANTFGIRDIAPNTTQITITDGDFAVIGFNQSTYSVHEQSGQDSSVDVCVQLISGTIAPGVSIDYTLEYDATGTTQDSSIDSTNGTFTDEVQSVCHHITVSENSVTEQNGKIVVGIQNSSLEPSNTQLSIVEADIYVFESDTLLVYINASDDTIVEGESTKVTVTYTGNLHSEITVKVDITITPGSALAGGDYDIVGIPSSHSVSLTASKPQSSFIVRATDDMILEDFEEYFTISISLDNANLLADIETTQVEITIRDNEVLRVSFKQPSFMVSESVRDTQHLPVMIDNFDSVPDGVSISISAVVNNATSNATQDTDYTIRKLDLVFDQNTPSTGQNMSFIILSDMLVEGNEVIEFVLLEAVVNNLTNSNAVVRAHWTTVVIITDDDELRVGFTKETTSAEEGDRIEVCAKILNGTLATGLSLHYMIRAHNENPDLPLDSANFSSAPSASDEDYIKTAETIVLSAKITEKCFTILLIDDAIVEMNETFLVKLEQNVTSEDLIFRPNPEYTEVIIEDNDEMRVGFEMPEYQLSEGAGFLPDSVYIVRENGVRVSSDFAVTVIIIQATSTADAAVDFTVPSKYITFTKGDERKPFSLNIENDLVCEGDEKIELLIVTSGDLDGIIPGQINTTSITIIEDDFMPYQYTQPEYSFTENAASTQVCVETVTGDFQFTPGGYLTIELFTSHITAMAGVDYSDTSFPMTVTLSENNRTGCTNVSIIKDMLVEGQEDFYISIKVRDYSGSYTQEGSNLTKITIVDSNVAEVGFESSLYKVIEGKEMNVRVCVLLLSGQLSDAVSLNYSLSLQAWNATENVDYGSTISPEAATLSQTSKSSCHYIMIHDDEDTEGQEVFSVSIEATGPSEDFISLFSITVPETNVTIIDNVESHQDTSLLIAILISAVGLIVLVLIVIIALVCIRRRKHSLDLHDETPPGQPMSSFNGRYRQEFDNEESRNSNVDDVKSNNSQGEEINKTEQSEDTPRDTSALSNTVHGQEVPVQEIDNEESGNVHVDVEQTQDDVKLKNSQGEAMNKTEQSEDTPKDPCVPSKTLNGRDVHDDETTPGQKTDTAAESKYQDMKNAEQSGYQDMEKTVQSKKPHQPETRNPVQLKSPLEPEIVQSENPYRQKANDAGQSDGQEKTEYPCTMRVAVKNGQKANDAGRSDEQEEMEYPCTMRVAVKNGQKANDAGQSDEHEETEYPCTMRVAVKNFT